MATQIKETTNEDSPWTKLGISVDLSSSLTRHVLIEKFSFEKAKEIEMKNFFLSKINGCELYLNSEHPNYIFYIKKINGNNEILMEKCEKNKTIHIKYTGIWSVFENQYMIQYDDIQLLTQGYLLEALNSQGYTTFNCFFLTNNTLLEALNSQGYTTSFVFNESASKLLESLNSKGYKTK